MAEKTSRTALARSLRAIMRATKVKGPEVAKRAGLDPKTVNNMVNGRFGASLDNVAAVAKALNLELWQLFMPDYIEAYLQDGQNLKTILSAYCSTDDTGRSSILNVAEMAARLHNNRHSPPLGLLDKR